MYRHSPTEQKENEVTQQSRETFLAALKAQYVLGREKQRTDRAFEQPGLLNALGEFIKAVEENKLPLEKAFQSLRNKPFTITPEVIDVLLKQHFVDTVYDFLFGEPDKLPEGVAESPSFTQLQEGYKRLLRLFGVNPAEEEILAADRYELEFYSKDPIKYLDSINQNYIEKTKNRLNHKVQHPLVENTLKDFKKYKNELEGYENKTIELGEVDSRVSVLTELYTFEALWKREGVSTEQLSKLQKLIEIAAETEVTVDQTDLQQMRLGETNEKLIAEYRSPAHDSMVINIATEDWISHREQQQKSSEPTIATENSQKHKYIGELKAQSVLLHYNRDRLSDEERALLNHLDEFTNALETEDFPFEVPAEPFQLFQLTKEISHFLLKKYFKEDIYQPVCKLVDESSPRALAHLKDGHEEILSTWEERPPFDRALPNIVNSRTLTYISNNKGAREALSPGWEAFREKWRSMDSLIGKAVLRPSEDLAVPAVYATLKALYTYEVLWKAQSVAPEKLQELQCLITIAKARPFGEEVSIEISDLQRQTLGKENEFLVERYRLYTAVRSKSEPLSSDGIILLQRSIGSIKDTKALSQAWREFGEGRFKNLLADINTLKAYMQAQVDRLQKEKGSANKTQAFSTLLNELETSDFAVNLKNIFSIVKRAVEVAATPRKGGSKHTRSIKIFERLAFRDPLLQGCQKQFKGLKWSADQLSEHRGYRLWGAKFFSEATQNIKELGKGRGLNFTGNTAPYWIKASLEEEAHSFKGDFEKNLGVTVDGSSVEKEYKQGGEVHVEHSIQEVENKLGSAERIDLFKKVQANYSQNLQYIMLERIQFLDNQIIKLDCDDNSPFPKNELFFEQDQACFKLTGAALKIKTFDTQTGETIEKRLPGEFYGVFRADPHHSAQKEGKLPFVLDEVYASNKLLLNVLTGQTSLAEVTDEMIYLAEMEEAQALSPSTQSQLSNLEAKRETIDHDQTELGGGAGAPAGGGFGVENTDFIEEKGNGDRDDYLSGQELIDALEKVRTFCPVGKMVGSSTLPDALIELSVFYIKPAIQRRFGVQLRRSDIDEIQNGRWPEAADFLKEQCNMLVSLKNLEERLAPSSPLYQHVTQVARAVEASDVYAGLPYPEKILSNILMQKNQVSGDLKLAIGSLEKSNATVQYLNAKKEMQQRTVEEAVECLIQTMSSASLNMASIATAAACVKRMESELGRVTTNSAFGAEDLMPYIVGKLESGLRFLMGPQRQAIKRNLERLAKVQFPEDEMGYFSTQLTAALTGAFSSLDNYTQKMPAKLIAKLEHGPYVHASIKPLIDYLRTLSQDPSAASQQELETALRALKDATHFIKGDDYFNGTVKALFADLGVSNDQVERSGEPQASLSAELILEKLEKLLSWLSVGELDKAIVNNELTLAVKSDWLTEESLKDKSLDAVLAICRIEGQASARTHIANAKEHKDINHLSRALVSSESGRDYIAPQLDEKLSLEMFSSYIPLKKIFESASKRPFNSELFVNILRSKQCRSFVKDYQSYLENLHPLDRELQIHYSVDRLVDDKAPAQSYLAFTKSPVTDRLFGSAIATAEVRHVCHYEEMFIKHCANIDSANQALIPDSPESKQSVQDRLEMEAAQPPAMAVAPQLPTQLIEHYDQKVKVLLGAHCPGAAARLHSQFNNLLQDCFGTMNQLSQNAAPRQQLTNDENQAEANKAQVDKLCSTTSNCLQRFLEETALLSAEQSAAQLHEVSPTIRCISQQLEKVKRSAITPDKALRAINDLTERLQVASSTRDAAPVTMAGRVESPIASEVKGERKEDVQCRPEVVQPVNPRIEENDLSLKSLNSFVQSELARLKPSAQRNQKGALNKYRAYQVVAKQLQEAIGHTKDPKRVQNLILHTAYIAHHKRRAATLVTSTSWKNFKKMRFSGVVPCRFDDFKNTLQSTSRHKWPSLLEESAGGQKDLLGLKSQSYNVFRKALLKEGVGLDMALTPGKE